MKVDLTAVPGLHAYYEKSILPALKTVHGCLFASLIQSHEHPTECMSMTLWETRAHADEYSNSPLYRDLVAGAQPYLVNSNEWRVQLSRDLTLEVVPSKEEPVVQKYFIDQYDKGEAAIQAGAPLFVRIVALNIQPGKEEEFRTIFSNDVLPQLRTAPGCRYAFLTEAGEKEHEFLSITIWDSEQAAMEYESGELIGRLTDAVAGTFSNLFRWKTELENKSGQKIITSEDTTVKHYQVVTGESFRGI